MPAMWYVLYVPLPTLPKKAEDAVRLMDRLRGQYPEYNVELITPLDPFVLFLGVRLPYGDTSKAQDIVDSIHDISFDLIADV